MHCAVTRQDTKPEVSDKKNLQTVTVSYKSEFIQLWWFSDEYGHPGFNTEHSPPA